MLTSVFAILLEELPDLVASLTIGDLDIVLGRPIVGHEREKVIVSDIELYAR
jgi:hypothetical protein